MIISTEMPSFRACIRTAFIAVLLMTPILIVIVGIHIFKSVPATFVEGQVFVIEEGASLRDIAQSLEASGYISSDLAFRVYARFFGSEKHIKAGSYVFREPLTLTELYHVLEEGESRAPNLRFTAPEGFRLRDLHLYLPEPYNTLSFDDFLDKEGYVFPDTYELTRTETADSIIQKMADRFTDATASYEVASSTLTFDEIIILASLIEREANTKESKRHVSGILQNRLKKDMLLQVDAVFDYLIGKESSELTRDDLSIASPFNTYTERGLPPSPIANPGLESINAVISPISSDDLYYLTAPDGTFYYAKTFEEHKRNKARYLR